MKKEVIIDLNLAAEMIMVLEKTYKYYTSKTRNEIATLLKRIQINTKSRGWLGSTGVDFYKNNEANFSHIKELVSFRRLIKDCSKSICEAHKNTSGYDYSIKEEIILKDDEWIDRLLIEISDLMRVNVRWEL